MRITAIIALLLAIAANSAAESHRSDKRALTIADLYDIKNVDDPQCSPDGNQVAFTVTTMTWRRARATPKST